MSRVPRALCPLQDDKEYVGFATLPNQVHRKSVKKGFDFTLMVAGTGGAEPGPGVLIPLWIPNTLAWGGWTLAAPLIFVLLSQGNPGWASPPWSTASS